MALLLPPLARRDRRRATLDLARDRERRAAHGVEAPFRLDAHVHVDAARAAGLRPPGALHVVEHRAHDAGGLDNLLPPDARHRIEIDAQLVRVIEIGGARRVRVQVDAPEVHDPRELRGVGDDDLVGGAPRGKRERDRLDPVGVLLRRALLEERRPSRAVDETLQRHRPVRDAAHGPVGDGEVITDEIALRLPGLGKEDLARIGHHDLATGDAEDLSLCVGFLRGHLGARWYSVSATSPAVRRVHAIGA